jgi:hypothetical protein
MEAQVTEFGMQEGCDKGTQHRPLFPLLMDDLNAIFCKAEEREIF